ncbi:MAG: AraC family transcriptional regulator [Spirochaetales bacterium]|nr:AraC family transcriptional regulator [Spirochaetales bacterium]
MDWITRFNHALRYVEQNLTEELDFDNIAAEAYTSSFHFQRMFNILSNVTLAEYIRRRRLTLAAVDILKGAEILETALKYGYESQASFTRAFSRMHGFTPGTVRKPGVSIKAYPPLSFQLTVKGEYCMDYEIKNLGEITVAGEMRHFTSKDGQNFKEIPQFWQELEAGGEIDTIMSHSDPNGILRGSCLGICMDFSEQQEEFNYMIGMEPKKGADVKPLKTRIIKPHTWAVFRGSGPMPDAIQKVWKQIFSEWFPATDYTHAGDEEIEVYPPAEDCVDNIPFEIWIPVKKGK